MSYQILSPFRLSLSAHQRYILTTLHLRKVLLLLSIFFTVCTTQNSFAQPPPEPFCWLCPDSVNGFSYANNQVRIYTDTNVSCNAFFCGPNPRYAKITIELPPDTCCVRICWIEVMDKELDTRFQVCQAKVFGGNCDNQDWFVLNHNGVSWEPFSTLRKPSQDSCNLAYHKALMPYYPDCPGFCDCCLMNLCQADQHPNKIEIIIAWDRMADGIAGFHDFWLEFKMVNDDDHKCYGQVDPGGLVGVYCPHEPTLGHPNAFRIRL